jgi:pilus assembly protein Flp/PilA
VPEDDARLSARLQRAPSIAFRRTVSTSTAGGDMQIFKKPAAEFARADDGSQTVEYALIIALVSIVLALALNNVVTGLANSLAELGTRVTDCFSSSGTC